MRRQKSVARQGHKAGGNWEKEESPGEVDWGAGRCTKISDQAITETGRTPPPAVGPWSPVSRLQSLASCSSAVLVLLPH